MQRISRAALQSFVGLCVLWTFSGAAFAQGLPGQLPGQVPGQLPGKLPGQLPAQPPAPPKPAPAIAGMPPEPCCDVTMINKATGVVTARQRSGGKLLEFKVPDAALLHSIRVGQDVFADMAGKRVSLDRKTFCCSIVKTEIAAPAAPAPSAPKVAATEPAKTLSPQTKALPGAQLPGPASSSAPPATPQSAPHVMPATRPSAIEPAKPGAAVAQAQPGRMLPGSLLPGKPSAGAPPASSSGAHGSVAALKPGALAERYPSEPLPQLTAGTLRQLQPTQMREEGPAVSPGVVHLHGIDGIKNASGIPQGARDFLVLHARTLEAHEEDTYIVNVKHAEEWFKTHRVPDSVTKAAKDDGKKKKKGCSTKHISTGCVKNEVQQTVDDLTNVWRKAWSDTSAEAARDWKRAKDCFEDHELPPLSVPVAFSTTNEFPVPISIPYAHGSMSVAVPVNAKFTATLKVFYIPCLPFAIRPKSLGADGWLESGGILKGSLTTTTGHLNHTFLFPIGGGGATLSMGKIPVGIHGAPVSTMEVAVYLEGRLTFDGNATLNGSMKLQSLHKIGYDFECTGHGCSMSVHGLPDTPTTAIESVKLDGKMIVRPEIYSALKLGFGGKMLEAQAGARPYLLGELYGCGGATAMQNTAGDSSLTPSHALTADLDWGLDMRAEAFAANKRVAVKDLSVGLGPGGSLKRVHILFKDLAQSTGLVPTVAGSKQGSVGQLSAFTIKMPQCYPFRDSPDNAIQYQVKWTGNASPTASAGAGRASQPIGLASGKSNAVPPADTCSFQSGQATCQGVPSRDTAFQLAWPASGSYVVSVSAVSDKHGRKFESSATKEFAVTVQ